MRLYQKKKNKLEKGEQIKTCFQEISTLQKDKEKLSSNLTNKMAKVAITLKLGLRNISKRRTSIIVFKHLHSTTTCFDSYNSLFFKTIDKANSKFNFKIKETLHINWRKKPNLNAQQNHLALAVSL